MWTITLRDLQFRARQFGIAVGGAAIVFALTLVMSGVSAGFRHEARDTVRNVGADAWIVPKGVRGPFTAQTSMPASLSAKVAAEPGVRDAKPLVKVGQMARVPGGKFKPINLFGHAIGGVGPPQWGSAAGPAHSGEIVVDDHLGVHNGDVVTIGGKPFRVRDVVSNQTFYAGVPVVWMDLADAQALAFGKQPLTSVIVTKGVPTRLPPGYAAVTPKRVRNDLLEPLRGAIDAIDSLRLLMWIVAAVIIGAVVYLSALERVRDFAVLKAVGGSSRDLVISLTTEAVVASVIAAGLAAGVAQVLKPAFPLPVVIESSSYFLLPLIAVLVGTIASLAALRRAVGVDPALAFAG